MTEASGIIKKPLYMLVHDELVGRIRSGEWKPGCMIPNELQLTKELGISQGTLRKGLEAMEAEHLLTRRQGRGTFVNDAASYASRFRFSNIRRLDGSRIRPEVVGISTTKRMATADEARKLHLATSGEVIAIERFRTVDRKPYLFETVLLPANLFPGVEALASVTFRIAPLAQQFGNLLGRAQEVISLQAPDTRISEVLQVSAQNSLVRIERVVFALEGWPVEWRVGICDLANLCVLREIP